MNFFILDISTRNWTILGISLEKTRDFNTPMDPHGSPSNAAAACSFPSACMAAARRGVVVKKVGLGTLGKGKPWENRGKTVGIAWSCDFSNFENWLEGNLELKSIRFPVQLLFNQSTWSKLVG